MAPRRTRQAAGRAAGSGKAASTQPEAGEGRSERQSRAAEAVQGGQRRRVGRGKKAAAAPAPAEAAAGGQQQQRRSKRQRKEVVVPEPEQHCFCMEQPAIRVGTSGYSYKHWRQGYYGGLPQRFEFEAYAKEFDMVELNATFYGWFDESTYDAWRERASAVRPTFQYVVKAPQLYTHRKRLHVDEVFTASWQRFWARCQRLGPHLGPVLFQFPANFKTTSIKDKQAVSNIGKLRSLGELLPKQGKFVFEFRDASWLCPEVYAVLKQHDWCLAITHLTDAKGRRKLEKSDGGWIDTLAPGPNPPPTAYPLDSCSWGVYVRFHGSEGQYCGAHGAAELRKWAGWAKQWVAQGRTVWFAFNNDAVAVEGELPPAVSDCRDLAAALRGNGLWSG